MARRTDFFCFAFVVLLSLTTVAARAQRGSLGVVFDDGSPPPPPVPTLLQGQVVFVSVNDLAARLRLPVLRQTPTTLELTAGSMQVKLAARNPFLVLTDSSGQPSGYQLAFDVVTNGGKFYVPLGQFLAVLGPRLSTSLSLDPSGDILHVGATPSATPDNVVSGLEMQKKANGMLIRIPLSPALTNIEHWTTDDGWLYLTIADARGNVRKLNATKPVGYVKKVAAIQSAGSLQLSFRLSDASLTDEVSRDQGNGDLIVTLRKEAPAPPLRLDLSTKRDRWALDVIVIDPGHGGKDAGAIGVTGLKEKDVTLGIALKLGALIKRELKGVKVVYTRSTDRFVELDKRGTIANEAGGKLFISIHCNSMPRKPNPTRGFEVYLLRPGRTDEAIDIAERENAVIKLEQGYEEKYKHLTDENFILVTMAQNAHVKASEEFANILQREMETHEAIPNRGVKQAGFYVLVGASMPNVLVETAYLSNRQDEQFLRSQSGQEKIAESIALAVKRYKQEYERLLKEGEVEP
ncbi:MAG: N-acetylmuramoyl-L-alanine amidase [Bacteroidota bacterium]